MTGLTIDTFRRFQTAPGLGLNFGQRNFRAVAVPTATSP
jgi:hypothetical protein